MKVNTDGSQYFDVVNIDLLAMMSKQTKIFETKLFSKAAADRGKKYKAYTTDHSLLLHLTNSSIWTSIKTKELLKKNLNSFALMF